MTSTDTTEAPAHTAPGLSPSAAPAPDRPLKIFGWAGDLRDGCYLYRLKYPLDALAKTYGYTVRHDTKMLDADREEADIIVGQRVCLPGPTTVWQALAAEGRVRLVYELDDDLFSIHELHNPHAEFFAQPVIRDNIIANLRASHLITVSTEQLAEVVRKRAPGVEVVVLENCVPAALLDVPRPLHWADPRAARLPFILGWQGSATHGQDWAVAQPAVRRILREFDGDHPSGPVRMRFAGQMYPDGLPLDQIDHRPWTQTISEHYRRVARFHASLAPLVDTTFNRSKSRLRVVESMALGVPVVASRVHAYRDAVEDGVTGRLVRSPGEWYLAVKELIEAPEFRVALGGRAREVARERFTVEGNVWRWHAAYQAVTS